MVSCKYTDSSGFLKVVRNSLLNKQPFLAVLSLVVITIVLFPGPCNAQESTAEEEYEAQKRFMQLQSSVDDEDYMKAQLILANFKRSYSDSNFYKAHSKKVKKLAKEIEKKIKGIKAEDKIEYLFVPPNLETKLWKEYMSKAEMLVSQRQGKMGVAVLRVVYEDENLEHPSVRTDNSISDLNIYIGCCGGYSCMVSSKDEEAIFVGSEFRRYRDSDSNKQDVSVIGNVITGSIYHYPVKLKIEVEKGKATAFGEVFVRSIPKEFCGNLMIKVEAEDGLKLTDAAVNLRVTGFYPGITGTLKDGSCVFDSIGPGSYTVELARNNSFGSSAKSADVVLGKTTEVTINAYRHRMIEFDWRFRKSDEPNNWLSGRMTKRTREDWMPDGEWKDVRFPVIGFGDWIDNTCNIRRVNGNLMPVGTDEPFETMSFPSNISSSSRGYPIKEGDVFAWQREDHKQKGIFSEALIRIREITPVGIADDQNIPIQQKDAILPSQQMEESNSPQGTSPAK